MSDIVFSFVMATYNSESTIEKSLSSIREQDFDQDKIEIIVVDGMSSDKTREIARRYGCRVLDNKKRLPEIAKTIGLKAAIGKYLCIMDSDEVLPRKTILEEREKVLKAYPYVKCDLIGYATAKGSEPCTYYLNAVGDPFSCFIYRTYKDGSNGLVIRHGKKDVENNCYVGHFGRGDERPIADSGVIMDLGYINSHFNDEIDTYTTAAITDKIMMDTGYASCVIGDDNIHYTNASFSTYLSKLKFRIINNIFDVNGSGYSCKAQNDKKMSRRKYLFPFYTISLILPAVDGIRMSINYKHWIFLFHPFLCLYVLFTIVIMYTKKKFGVRKENKSYAK